MADLLKKAQTLIGSLISITLLSIITLILPKYQPPVYAIVDPLTTTNNKFGIHIISASADEASAAAQLVNSSGGDWGYVTFLMVSSERDLNKWQNFFDELRKRHLIPIVRLATKPVNSHWERPYEKEYEAWADFLDKLNWPIKNRYVIIYNEPNHGAEWGNFVDPKNYAETLDQVVTALKSKNRDFFVLNSGFDASAPQKPPLYMDQVEFMRQMNEEIPGIFNKLDGWVSHSYPNPEFIGSPNAQGRGTIRTWEWEIQKLKELGMNKILPVFITETGWKHAEGVNYNPTYPTPERVSNYFKTAFSEAWNSSRIVAITPFLLNYEQPPFDHFSFKKNNPEKSQGNILGVASAQENSKYHPHYTAIKNLPKIAGSPIQQNSAQLIGGQIPNSIVVGQNYKINLTLKNTGQSIWGERSSIKLVVIQGGENLQVSASELPPNKKVNPNQEHIFNLEFKDLSAGEHKIVANLFDGEAQFDNPSFEFNFQAKSPIILRVKSGLLWKETAQGEYVLSIKGLVSENIRVNLPQKGTSADIPAQSLLPDNQFSLTLQKPYYRPKTITQVLTPGLNIIDFDTLEPDVFSAIFNFKQLWQLLPFSN